MITYVVQPGDTLYLIANRYNTTVEALLRANNLSTPYVYVGQTLYIPAPGPVPGPGPGPGPAPGPGPGFGNLEQRVNRLEREFNQLNREVNRLDQRLDRLEQRVTKLER
ncbi:LysM peptidoglycan-binding domain-containing protein [Paenibacillus chitinolyticus]|uniref:LysM peptidoglycan-binding domain-containing protein n=1 Tax=Paenibacillus chitinolyticus TaxID=79263 RepID=UPI0035D5AC23